MTSFVLVHGSGQNASSWDRVGRALRAAGHAVATPELPKDADWRLEDYAARIAEEIATPDAVVVTHSFSGAFLPLVPAHRACRQLVFLAAVVPEPGVSVREQLQADASMFSSEWLAAGARWFDDAERERLAREFLFHDCDPGDLPWCMSTVEDMNTQPLIIQPAPFSQWPDVPMAAIVATEDRTLAPAWCARRARAALGVTPLEVHAGHCPQNACPDRVAELLCGLAQEAA